MNELRIGMVGLGTVGQGVAELLARHADLYTQRCGHRLTLAACLVRDVSRPRGIALPEGVLLTSDPVRFLTSEFDILVEVAGGTDMASRLIRTAIESGRDVVTANKALLAVQGHELFDLAERNGRRLSFEAAVAGGVPVIQTVASSLASNRLRGFAGILNGTCNFILTQMARGGTYDAALQEAQRLGFAEADPTLDVSGRDSLEKLCILATLAFGVRLDPASVEQEGITKLTQGDLADAGSRGGTIKLLAIAGHEGASAGSLRVWNGPTLVPHASPLSRVEGSNMGVLFEGDAVSSIFVAGDGAGRLPTASAVVADLLHTAHLLGTRRPGALNIWPVAAQPVTPAPLEAPLVTGQRGARIRSLLP
jgi:homoserine dehydrogenase